MNNNAISRAAVVEAEARVKAVTVSAQRSKMLHLH